MRIVSRKELMELPNNTVFSEYKGSGNIERLCIKTDTWVKDFIVADLLDQTDTNDSGEHMDLFDKAEADSSFEFRLDLECTARDGLFDDDKRYMVYDDTDVQALIDRLKLTIPESSQKEQSGIKWYVVALYHAETGLKVTAPDDKSHFILKKETEIIGAVLQNESGSFKVTVTVEGLEELKEEGLVSTKLDNFGFIYTNKTKPEPEWEYGKNIIKASGISHLTV